MDRYWFLTWTTYATWLPGDARGSVSNIAGDDGKGVRHNVPGTPCDADHPDLRRYMQQAAKCPPIYLSVDQALALLQQFQETARYRGWLLLAVGIMANHVHIVLGVPDDPDPRILFTRFQELRQPRTESPMGQARPRHLVDGIWLQTQTAQRCSCAERGSVRRGPGIPPADLDTE